MYRERTRREAFPEVPSRAADALFCQSRNFRLMLLSHTHTLGMFRSFVHTMHELSQNFQNFPLYSQNFHPLFPSACFVNFY